MSADDIKKVAEVLEGILKSDNNIRKQAEAQFDEMRKNIPGLILCLSKVVTGSLFFKYRNH